MVWSARQRPLEVDLLHPFYCRRLGLLLKGLDFDGLLFTFLDIAQQCMARAHLIVLTNGAEPLVNRIRTAIRSMMVDVLREVPGEERASMLRNLQQISRSLSCGRAADSLEPVHRVSSMRSPRESSRGELA